MLVLVAGTLIGVTMASCGGGSTPVARRTPPDLAAFLKLPVATPTSCAKVPAATVGRRSPWVGHVDVSVFIAAKADAATRQALHDSLVAMTHVARVYTETQREAYAEFQRLYTCSAQVPRSALPASYRLILDHVSTPQRDALVRQIYRLPGVSGVSCDPSSPCTNIGPDG